MATASNAFPIPSDEYINESPDAPPGRIAIIGAACRFPGADSPDRLAELLFDGREAIGPVAALRPAIAAGGIERAGLIAAPELFDPQFFGIAQREADQMDPQQRLALELAVEALEAAGLPRAGLAGSRTGVYLGISTYDYSRLQMRRGDGGELYAGTGNAFSIAANRISYWLNLAGPSMAVDTACSSSLTAVHLAVRALRAGEIDLALVGGVGLLLSGELMQVFAGAGMLAPDGRCKTFDAAADGYVRGEGGGMVVLRRAAEAAAAGDRVLALIAGSAVNQDGRSNGLTAPSGPAQSAVLRAALADAGLAPAEVDAVELHGTGTPLGDPIEAQALGEVYAAGRAAPLAVGSIKTNIGHLEAAAGIAGLIKAALALAARRLPPSLNFSRPNPDIDLAALGLAVATEAVPLDPIGRPARVGVSSFGFGGSNAHVVLEAAALPPALPAASPGEPGGEWLLPLSAASPEALAAQAGRLAERLRTLDPAALADLVHTATLRRDHLDHRLAAFGPLPVLIEALAAAVAGRPHPALLLGRRPATGPRRLALLGGDEACAEALRHWGVKAVAETADAALAERLAGRWDLLCVESDWPAGLPERLARAELPAGPPRLALGARLYVLGHALDWAAQAPLGQLVALPAYPWQRRRCWFAPESPAARGVVFLIPGQGNPQPGAAAALYRDHAGFRAAIDRCAALLDELLDVPLATLLFDAERGGPLLRQTRYAQPAQFALGWALAQLWAGWGVRPAALAGHSLGEYVAAVLAGMAPLEQVLPLVARRGALMQETADGAAMLLVRAGAADVAALVEARPAELALAADNGPASCVLAGTAAAIEAAAAGLAGRGIRSRLLDVAAAFHSPLMEPIVLRLAGLAAMVDWQAGGVPAIANLHGRRHAGAPDAAYWAAHARGTVRYREGLEALLADGHRLFLELGPRPALATLGPTLAGGAEAQWLAALDGPGRDWPALAEAAAALRQAGVALDPACACDLAPHSPSAAVPAAVPTASRQETAMSSHPSPADAAARVQQVRADVVEQIARALGEAPERLPLDKPFIEMGADSVMMAEAMRAIQARYGVRISARQLLNELDTVDALSAHLAAAVPAAATAGVPIAASPVAGLPVAGLPVAPLAMPALPPGAVPAEYAGLFQQQLQLVQQVIHGQLAALGSAPPPPAAAAQVQAIRPEPRRIAAAAGRGAASPGRSALDPRQAAHLAAFTHAYVARTAGSKRLADQRRERLADVRASAGFRPALKELVYPITGARAEGARLWDVDGNGYVDLSMDFGVNLFGHGAAILTEAIHRQAGLGLALGTRSPLAAEVSQLMCKLTGMDRVLFCQSGSESVMTALRLARLVRERSKVALFRKSYHGHFDGVLGDRAAVGEAAEPVAAGILPNFVADLLVLDYGSDAALEAIAREADSLAAVLVEPVQSRALDLQPREFLLRLRELTARHGILLIFDEMITGFRCAPGGAQQLFGVEADLATYGKTIGGGVPMAALAARGRLLDGIDGGIWRFGDDSAPDPHTTFFAGTFNNHPLGFALAHAVLGELDRRGPAFQESLNARTGELVDRLNARLAAVRAPLELIRFGSAFRFKHAGNLDLFYYHLLHRGLFVWEGRNCFLCEAHGAAELDAIVDGVMDSVAALREGGWLEPRPAAVAPSVPAPAAEAATLPLSDSQRQIWLATELDPAGAGAYCETVALEVDGELNPALLERALAQLALRHEALRTVLDAGGAGQTVQPALKPPLSYGEHDDVAGWLRGFVEAAFDPAAGGPLRAALLKRSDGRHVLALRAHHVLVDGWSLALIVDELGRLYHGGAALAEAQPFRRQLDWLAGAQDEAAERFWRDRVAEPPAPLALPGQRLFDAAARPRWEGERVRLALPAELAEKLAALAAGRRVTPFTAALALTLGWLHRLCDRDDILIGVPAHGRPDGLERMVGQAVQLMPLRSRIERGLRFDQLLHRLDLELEAMAAHQAHPLARIVEPVLAGGDERPGALTLTFNLDRVRDPAFAGLPTRLLDAPVAGVKFDLAINLLQSEQGWLLDLDYPFCRYPRAEVEQLGRRWIDWALRLAAAPEAVLDDCPALPAGELEQLLHGFAGAALAVGEGDSVPARFARMAAEHPERVAACADGKRIDYRTLDRAARAVAGNLAALGAGPGRTVAVMLPRSLELAATLLGIFYAGAVYLPIDPDEPAQRRDELFAEARPAALVTVAEIASRLAVGCPLLIVEPADALAASAEAATAPVPVGLHEPAYLIYTSGSTSKPKGVLGSHGNLANLLAWTCTRFPLGTDDAVLHKAPYTFDISLWELCWPLVAGARLVIAAPGGHRDPDYLVGQIVAERVTVAQFVPAMLEAFVAVPEAAHCRSLRQVFAGGEALHAGLRDAFHALGLGAALHNLYGPTEAGILVSHCECPPGEPGPLPLGRPIANTVLRIVDRLGQPVAVGQEGELLIGGLPLALGYLERPEQDARAFVAAAGVPGGRLYRTGDRARWRADGSVDYLGRADGQVKLRGQRIETGAIEHALRQCPGVQEAVVDLRGAQPAQQRLVAWFVPRAGQAIAEPAELRRALAARLPAYMLPAQFVPLAALPVSRHGKVDRQALVEPELPPPDAGDQAPRTPLETALLDYVRGTLQVALRGIDHDFFAAGGQSLAATQLIGWVQRQWSVKPALKDFFELPTVACLAALIEAAQADAPADGLRLRERRRVSRDQLSSEATLDAASTQGLPK